MTNGITDWVADQIRKVDGDNSMSATELGNALHFLAAGQLHIGPTDIPRFVERTNPDKRLGAGRLAELIVVEFQLDEEG